MSLRNPDSPELLRAHPAKMAAEASFYHDEYKEQNNINKSSVGDSESGRLCIHRIYLTFAGQNDLGCYILIFQGGGHYRRHLADTIAIVGHLAGPY